MTTPHHEPVLLAEILGLAAGGRRVVDGTLGDGGHAGGFLASGAEVLGIDRDPSAVARSRARLGEERMRYLTASFGSDAALAAVREFHPDFILLDLGVSSPQLDETGRGFSFREGAPLDMRMSGEGATAADLLNTAGEAELARVFREFADEPRGARLAREIIRRRARAPFATSDDLVNAIRGALGPRTGPGDFARLFQALRIAVNHELDELARALPAYRDALAPGGRLAVISYHSGEDRLVKHSFHEWARRCICPPAQPVCTCRGRPLGVAEPRKAVLATAAEVERNPRARSAKLRIFRTD